MKATAEQIQAALPHFTGTEQYYPHMCGTLLTDGAKFLAEKAECFWLMDIIASVKTQLRKLDHFHVCKLVVKDGAGTFTADDGNGNIHYTQEIPHTDFPLPEVKLYFVDNIILLPSEY